MSFNAPPPPGPSGRKVAIPRLQRTSLSQPSKERRRVTRACTACRSHKIKCTGDVPQCKHCEKTGRECVYVMTRKDRLKAVSERSVQMAGMLRKLRSLADDEDSARIGELLEATEEDMFETRQTTTISNPDTNDLDSARSTTMFDISMDESDERLERSNLGSLDLVDENLHETDQARAIGFVGMTSEVRWLRSFLLLERGDSDTTSPGGLSAGPFNNEQVSSVTFYLDSQHIGLDFHVDPYDLPTPEAAEQLLSTYMEKVHESFPILPRRLFEDQFRKYFEATRQGAAPRLSSKWRAILNMVFAIGAKHSHLVKASWQADERDHLVYKARAYAFAWNDSTLGQHPDLPQIQVVGLLAFYYLSVGQISRAWIFVGVAIRFATALGLHVRNEDPSASSSKREVLVRVWWSLYYLERQLSVITGRPSVIVDSYCSVPLPMPIPETHILAGANIANTLRKSSVASSVASAASSDAHTHPFAGSRPKSGVDSCAPPPNFGIPEANAGSYFKAVVQLCVITQSILTSLYSAGTMIRSPNELQQNIVEIGQRLDDWLIKLPGDLNFQGRFSSDNSSFRQRTLLTFQFCSARILLTRPCLSSLGKFQRADGAVSETFTQRMAGICVDAAKMEVDLLPDRPEPNFVYEYGPWWSLTHLLMQALAVFLLTLSYSPAMRQDNVVLARYCIKIIRWLLAMEDPQAERAYKVAVGCYEIVANRLSLPGVQMSPESHIPELGVAHDISAQPIFPGIYPNVDMVYPSNFSTAGYVPYAPGTDRMFVPSIDGQLYDEGFYHQHQ